MAATTSAQSQEQATTDPAALQRFAAMAAQWWHPHGPMAPLHRMNPVRIAWLRDGICRALAKPVDCLRPLGGVRVLDVGCGAGLLAEPLARLGAQVTGIDPTPPVLAAARLHAQESGLTIEYRADDVYALAAAGIQFDVVIASEVVEHVPDPDGFLRNLARLARPGGAVFVTTINKTLKSLALAKIGAEYILRWLPTGTHDWQRFVKPHRVAALLRAEGCLVESVVGFTYDPLRGAWSCGADVAVNYGLIVTRYTG